MMTLLDPLPRESGNATSGRQRLPRKLFNETIFRNGSMPPQRQAEGVARTTRPLHVTRFRLTSYKLGI